MHEFKLAVMYIQISDKTWVYKTNSEQHICRPISWLALSHRRQWFALKSRQNLAEQHVDLIQVLGEYSLNAPEKYWDQD